MINCMPLDVSDTFFPHCDLLRFLYFAYHVTRTNKFLKELTNRDRGGIRHAYFCVT